MDAAEARDIAYMRDRDEARQQIWRIEYQISGGSTELASLIGFIRADSHHDALRLLQSNEETITEARVRLADDQDRIADNDQWDH